MQSNPRPRALRPGPFHLQVIDTPPSPSPCLALPCHLSTHFQGDTPIILVHLGAQYGTEAGERDAPEMVQGTHRTIHCRGWAPQALAWPAGACVVHTVCDGGRAEWLQASSSEG